jgi:hypothetical protein
MTLPLADDVLGRTYTFRCNVDNTITLHTVRAVGYDPERGIKLTGDGFVSCWVDFFTWRRLRAEGVLEDA